MISDEMVENFGKRFWPVNAASKIDANREDIRAALEAALAAADPAAWYWEDATGCFHITLDRPDVKEMAATVGCEPKPLYPGNGETSRFFAQPAPSVTQFADRLFGLHGFMLSEEYGGKPAVTITFPDTAERNQFYSAIVDLSTHKTPAASASKLRGY